MRSTARHTALACALSLSGCLGTPSPSSGLDTGELPDTSDHGEFRVHIDAPAEGFRRGTNDFTASASDARGQAIPLAWVTAQMPDHGHITAAPSVSRDGSGWAITGLVLWDPGRWWVTLHFADGARYDDASFTVDVP